MAKATEARSAKAHLAKQHTRSSAIERELENELELDVPDWDFVSPHAIEHEYVELLASSVSVI